MKDLQSLSQLNKQNGMTLVEVGIAIIIGMVVLLLGLQGATVVQDKRKVSAGVTQYTQVYQAAADWRSTRSSYTGISMTTLESMNLLPDQLGDGTSVNPWGGNITISANSGNAGLVDIAMTNVPSGVSAQLEDKLEPSTSGGNTASVSGTTLTATFE